MSGPGVGVRNVWRTSRGLRVAINSVAVFYVVLEVAVGGGVMSSDWRYGAIVGALVPICAVPLTGYLAWALGYRPRIALDHDTVTIVNPFGTRRIKLDDVLMVGSSYWGLIVVDKKSRRTRAWAVQKSNAATVMRRTTRSDTVVAAILSAKAALD